MTAILAFGRETYLSGVGDLAARELGEQEAEKERLVQVRTSNEPLSHTGYVLPATRYEYTNDRTMVVP